jgi:hypothetical protein
VILAHGYEQDKVGSVLNKAPHYEKFGGEGTELTAACILNTDRRKRQNTNVRMYTIKASSYLPVKNRKKNSVQLVSDKRFEPQTSRNKAKMLNSMAQTFVFNEATHLSIDFVCVNKWLLTILLVAT